MRRAIVHIGMPRTGTTTIQRVLHDRAREFLSAGVLYPDLTPRSAPCAHLSHQHLGEALDGRRPAGERSELITALELALTQTQAEVVVLSYEGLILAPRRLVLPERLRALFARHGFAMETLVSVKPQSEYLNSTYTWRTQFLREARGFQHYLPAAIGWRQFDYETLVEPWRQASNGCVHVLPVRDRLSDRALLARFLEICLPPSASFALSNADLTLVENRSPSPIVVETARQLRIRGVHLRKMAREATRLVEELAHARGLDAPPFQGVSEQNHAYIQQVFAARNERFARASWSQSWDARVAAQPYRDVNEIAGRIHDPDIVAVIADLTQTTLARLEANQSGFTNLQQAAYRLLFRRMGERSATHHLPHASDGYRSPVLPSSTYHTNRR